MDDLYKANQLYKTIDLFCKLRNISKSAMCSKAGISPGIISDLKFGRKQTIQIETASKIAKALNTTVSAIESNTLVATKWDVEIAMMWNDCDSDEERFFILQEHGVDASVLITKEYRSFADRVVLKSPNTNTEKENLAPKNGSEAEIELIKLFKRLSPEEQERELAYLKSRVSDSDN